MILKKNLSLLLVTALGIGLIGCSSGDDDSSSSLSTTLTGTFVDAPVKGLNYSTATQSGFTDAQGHFKYKNGEHIQFLLGTLLLGETQAKEEVTPYDITDNNVTKAANIAAILQNFDAERSNRAVIDLSKLHDYNFTADNLSIAVAANELEVKLNDLLATGNFQDYIDKVEHGLITVTQAKKIMDDMIYGTSSSTGADSDKNTSSSSVTSEGIYIAQSSETTKNIYQFSNFHPILYHDKVYTRLMRYFDINVDKGMKVVEYNLSKFTGDTTLNTLLSHTIYEATQAGSDTNPSFNQRYYDILRIDNALYFSILPSSKEEKSQSGRLKYNLSTNSVDYALHIDPTTGQNLNTTFDLTQGWFIPFGNHDYIAIIEDSLEKVINANDGTSYKYDKYDYFGAGSTSGSYSDGLPPVGNDSRFISASSEKIHSSSFLPDASYVDYGRAGTQDPEYIESDILEDFKTLYSGSKNYIQANYSGETGGLDTPELILDGNTVYNIAKLAYKNSEGYRLNDLYLLKYDLRANLQDIKLLDEGTQIGSSFYAYQPYKYKDNLLFKITEGSKHYLYSYNLVSNTFNFKHQIGTENIEDRCSLRDSHATSYVVTGDTIILPEYIMSKKQEEYDTYIDLVFNVLNISDGSVKKTLHHQALQEMKCGVDKIGYAISSVSDENSVYFFAQKETQTARDKLIIKIDSPHNKVIKPQYRMDNHYTGVIYDN